MNVSDTQTLIIITPAFEDREASTRLFKELAAVNPNIFVVAVDDGSVREPLTPIALKSSGLKGVILSLKRNVGHQQAIAIGINYVAEHFPCSTIVVMDSDGEDLPVSINIMLEKLLSEEIDIVVAQRKNRVETLDFKIFYFVYKYLFRMLSGQTISFGNFMAIKPHAAQRLASMEELWIHIAGCVLISKLRMNSVLIDRGARYAGHSKMNFVGLVLHGFKALMIFAEEVLVRVGIACASVALLSFIAMPVPLVLKGFGMATPGWSSVLFGLLMLIFIQTGALTLLTLLLTGLTKFNTSTRNYRDYILSYSFVIKDDFDKHPLHGVNKWKERP